MSELFRSSVMLSAAEGKMISHALKEAGRNDLADLIDKKYGCAKRSAMFSELARVLEDDELSFDDLPAVSLSDEGAFVSAWVWVSSPDEYCDAA